AASAFDLSVGREANPQIQIAGLCAARPHLTFAGHTNARSVGDAGRNPDIHGARVAILLDRQPLRRAVIRIFETELDFLLHVASGARAARSAAAPAAGAVAACAAKERLEEVGEGMLVSEHLAHFV